MCQNALTVTGLDLGRLSYPQGRDGARRGGAKVEGVYRAGDRVTAGMLVVTEPVARLLRSLAGGRLVPTPILHRLR
jgi:hypothetical protein